MYFLTVWILMSSNGHMFPMGGEYKNLHECEHQLVIIQKNLPPRMGFNLDLLIGECSGIY